MSRLWLVTGTRGAGKTSYCQAAARRGQERGLDVAGVLSPGVFTGGEKVGIDVVDLRSGQRRRLADLRVGETSTGSGLSTQRWRFDPSALEWGSQVLAQAVPCDLLVVDELGPLEFERGQGWLSGLAALDGGQYRLGLAVVRPELLEVALARWPGASVKRI